MSSKTPLVLRYKGDEGLVVCVTQYEHAVLVEVEIVTATAPAVEAVLVFAKTLEDAQVLARLLVGIEIQPDGAAWKRGPRPPAQPTDKDGNITPHKYEWTEVKGFSHEG